MSQFQINNQQNMNYTLIANQFIDGFLADANDAQIKVYLYLLRHMNNEKMCSISAMADCFNYSEKDVLRALSYWERKRILQLTFDNRNELCGITLSSFTKPQSSNMSGFSTGNKDTQTSADTLSSRSLEPAPKIQSQTDVPMVKTVTYMSNTSTFVKPEYTLDQLAEFKSRESTAELMFIAESYLGKTLSANDVRSILFISDKLHFSFDLIDYLLQYCIDRGKRDFRYIEKVAISWAEAHITTPEQAQTQTTKYDKDTYTVMNALGKNNQPTPKEAEYIKRWYQIYGFTSDVILEACERTVLATDKHRFEYADKILNSWKTFGVHHKTDIAKADAAFATNKKKSSAPSVSAKNKFNQFKQNDYDFDALEKELLSN